MLYDIYASCFKMDRLLQVILALLLVTSTIAQLLESLHGPHGARNPVRLSNAGSLSALPYNAADDWNHRHFNGGGVWMPGYPPLKEDNNEYKDKPVVFEYIKPRPALENYLRNNKTLPVHYGIIDWDTIRKYLNNKSHSDKGKVEVRSSELANKRKIKQKNINKLEEALKNKCSTPFLWRSKEKNLRGNIYDLSDPNNAWNMYIGYGLKGPVKVRKNVLGTKEFILEDPLIMLKGILQRHSKIPMLSNGYIDWNKVFKLSDDDFRYFKLQLFPLSKRPVRI